MKIEVVSHTDRADDQNKTMNGPLCKKRKDPNSPLRPTDDKDTVETPGEMQQDCLVNEFWVLGLLKNGRVR